MQGVERCLCLLEHLRLGPRRTDRGGRLPRQQLQAGEVLKAGGRRFAQRLAPLRATPDAQRLSISAVDVQNVRVARPLAGEEGPQPLLLRQRRLDVVGDHAGLHEAAQHRAGRCRVVRGRVHGAEGVAVLLRDVSEGERRPVALVVAQPDKRIEHAGWIDVRSDAMPLELRVDERHVELDCVVPAQERALAASAALPAQQLSEVVAHHIEAGRAPHLLVANIMQLARLHWDGHARVHEH